MTISRPGIGRTVRYGQIVPSRLPNAPQSLTRGFLQGTRQVGGLQTSAATQAIEAQQRLGQIQSRYTSNMGEIDYRRTNDSINSMLRFFGEGGGANVLGDTVKEVYGRWSSRATGNLLSDPNFIEAASKGDKEQLARIRPLTRADQQAVGSVLLGTAVNPAIGEYKAKVLSDPRLTDLALQGLSPEERSRKVSEIKTEYKQGYNQQLIRSLSQYFPEAAKQIIPGYMQGLGQVDATAMERQTNAMMENSLNGMSQGLLQAAAPVSAGLEEVVAEINTNADLTPEEKAQQTRELQEGAMPVANKTIGAKVQELIDAEPLGAPRAAQRVAGVGTALVDKALALSSAGDYTGIYAAQRELSALLTGLQEYDKKKESGELRFLDTPFNQSGETLEARLYKEMERLQRESTQQTAHELKIGQIQEYMYTERTGTRTDAFAQFVLEVAENNPALADQALAALRASSSDARSIINFQDRQQDREYDDNYRARLFENGGLPLTDEQMLDDIAGGLYGENQGLKNRELQQKAGPARVALTEAYKPLMEAIIRETTEEWLSDPEILKQKIPGEDDSGFQARMQKEIARQLLLRVDQIIAPLEDRVDNGDITVYDLILKEPGMLKGLLMEDLNRKPLDPDLPDKKKSPSNPTEQAQESSEKALTNINNAGGKDTMMNYPSRFVAEAQSFLKKSGLDEEYTKRGIYDTELVKKARDFYIKYLGRIDASNDNKTNLKQDFIKQFRQSQREGSNKPTGLTPSKGKRNLMLNPMEFLFGPQSWMRSNEQKAAQGLNEAGVTMAMVMPEAVAATATTPAPQPSPAPEPVNEGLQKAGRAALNAAVGERKGPVSIPVVYEYETNEGYSALAALSTGREEITDSTPPLPQISATAPVSRLTFDLARPDHPWNLSRMASNIYRYRRGGGAFDPSAGATINQARGRLGGIGPGNGMPVPINYGLQVTSFEGAGGEGGIDMYSENGKFPAMLPGVVKDIGWDYTPSTGRGWGNFVAIEHRDPDTGETFTGIYGHLGRQQGQGIYVKIGQQVNAGDFIGEQGSTGSVRSADGTIASFDLYENEPRGGGYTRIYKRANAVRQKIAAAIGQKQLLGGYAERTNYASEGKAFGFTEFLSSLESDRKPNSFNSKSGTAGYFQFKPGTIEMGERYGIPNFRRRILSNDRREASLAVLEFIKAQHPKAYGLILKGDYDAAFPLLNKTWTSLPGGAQSRSERVSAARRFLR